MQIVETPLPSFLPSYLAINMSDTADTVAPACEKNLHGENRKTRRRLAKERRIAERKMAKK